MRSILTLSNYPVPNPYIMAVQIWNYLENTMICVQDCGEGEATDFGNNTQSGELSNQLNVCCTDACRYAVDPNTGLLFPVLCDT